MLSCGFPVWTLTCSALFSHSFRLTGKVKVSVLTPVICRIAPLLKFLQAGYFHPHQGYNPKLDQVLHSQFVTCSLWCYHSLTCGATLIYREKKRIRAHLCDCVFQRAENCICKLKVFYQHPKTERTSPRSMFPVLGLWIISMWNNT